MLFIDNQFFKPKFVYFGQNLYGVVAILQKSTFLVGY